MFARSLRCAALLACLGTPAAAATSPWVGDAHAAARLVAATRAVGSAAALDAAVAFRLAPGWHIYWRSPGDAGLPPAFDWGGSHNLARAEIGWPAPRRFSVSGLQTAIYEGAPVLPVRLVLQRPGEALQARLTLDYAACAAVCVPYHATVSLDLPAGLATPDPAEAAAIAGAEAAVPGDPASVGLHLEAAIVAPDHAAGSTLALTLGSDGGPLRAPDLFVEGLGAVTPGPPAVDLDAAGRRARLLVGLPSLRPDAVAGRRLAVTLVDGDRSATFAVRPQIGALPAGYGAGWLALLGVALLGGLVLNAMPCVLPVLSLKLLAVAAHRGAGRRAMRGALLATAAGVVLTFLLLAAALVGLRAAGVAVGWGIQFQQPWFLAGMALLTALFAAACWDVLPLGVPGLSTVAGLQSRRPWLDALLTGVVATLLATPCSAPFVGTAVGFALSRGPKEIVAIFAALGLGMAAPYLLVAAVPELAGLLPRPGAWMRTLRRAMGVLLAATAVWLLTVLSAVTGPAPVVAQSGWQAFDAAAIPGLVARGRTVLVDVTAAWCLTCKTNALAVLDRDPVASRLRGPSVAVMRADWTRPDPAISRYLQRFGRYGVPLDVVYGPASPAGIALPELLTPGTVLDALATAQRQHLASR